VGLVFQFALSQSLSNSLSRSSFLRLASSLTAKSQTARAGVDCVKNELGRLNWKYLIELVSNICSEAKTQGSFHFFVFHSLICWCEELCEGDRFFKIEYPSGHYSTPSLPITTYRGLPLLGLLHPISEPPRLSLGYRSTLHDT